MEPSYRTASVCVLSSREKLEEAKTQLRRYAADARVVKRNQGAKLSCVALVFSGWELKIMQEVIVDV